MERGYQITAGATEERSQESEELSLWEHVAADTVGNFIEFWGFKRNQGRVWALLYLKGRPLSALELQRYLSLSKGAVSMLSRELEQWGVIHRVRVNLKTSWHFVAETDLMQMISRVLRERESGVISRVKADLVKAEELASEDESADQEMVERLRRMRRLAEVAERSLEAFLKTSKLDLGSLFSILRDTTQWIRGKKRL